MSTKSSYAQIDPRDNIIVAITDLPKGLLAEINGQNDFIPWKRGISL